MGRTPRQRSRLRTYRNPTGGAKTLAEKIAAVNTKLDSTSVPPYSKGNDASDYVVGTYWWGEANVNRNLQLPCPEEVTARAKRKIVLEHQAEFPATLTSIAAVLKEIDEKGLLPADKKRILQAARDTWNSWQKALFEKQEVKDQLKAAETALLTEERAAHPNDKRYRDRKFPEMIKEWEAYCAEAGVNFLALQTEFGREDYQAGINAKPRFIKKLLDSLRELDPANPKGVLYIDGDMWIHKYPKIFDIPGVDFMARGWNIDPRSKAKSLASPYYDPMIFETSGGTMYFGNTDAARRLLDAWAEASDDPSQAGKADDRILSQIFTTKSMVVDTNIINLPIEYLWLTDLYAEFKDKLAEVGTGIDKAVIEHAYCLTGEERAADQGAAANRTPAGYDEEVVDAINYKRPTELIYEYIMFNGNKEMRDEMGPYLSYLSGAVGHFTKAPIAKIVPFDARYGEHTATAEANLQGLPEPVKPTGNTVSVTTGSIKEILTALRAGNNVWTGPGEAPERSSSDIECYAEDASTKDDNADPYTRFIQVNAGAPMFFSAKSPILPHLLAMCKTLPDINTHLKKSYLFLSRIRWELVKPGAAPAPKAAAGAFPKIVHQIWFGTGDMGWRKALFEKNKKLCEEHGYQHKLWIESDRTKENFEITHAYQEEAKKRGNTRWAQVADLGRLEIVYNSGGIYADSLIELTPALFTAVEAAMDAGADFVGCNEDPCDPFAPDGCKGSEGKSYLTNSFFAAKKACPLFKRLLDDKVLDAIDFDNKWINRTTGPYFLRTMVQDPVADKVVLLQSAQIFPFNEQATAYRPARPDPFILTKQVPGSVDVGNGKFLLLGGPLAIYHSGLGGTWSPE